MSAPRTIAPKNSVTARPNPKVRSPERMVDIVNQVLFTEPRVGIPSTLPSMKELIGVRPKKHKKPGTVNYDLRAMSAPYSVRGVVGSMTEVQFRGMVYETLRASAEQFEKILGGTWKPCAARIEWTDRSRLIREPSGADPDAVFSYTLDAEKMTVGNNKQSNKLVKGEEQDLTLEVAFFEVTRRSIVCPLYEKKQNRSGQRYPFADTDGLPEKMGPSDRRLREHAIELIQFSYGDVEEVQAANLPAAKVEDATRFLRDYNMSYEQVARALEVTVPVIMAFDTMLKSKEAAAKEGGDGAPSE